MYKSYLKTITTGHDNSVYYSHFTPFNVMLERLFDDTIYSANRSPKITENDDSYVLELQLPGYKQSHLDITVEQDVMTVKTNKENGSFERSFTLPQGVDTERIDAKLEDGILSINLPKSLISKPRKVTVK